MYSISWRNVPSSLMVREFIFLFYQLTWSPPQLNPVLSGKDFSLKMYFSHTHTHFDANTHLSLKWPHEWTWTSQSCQHSQTLPSVARRKIRQGGRVKPKMDLKRWLHVGEIQSELNLSPWQQRTNMQRNIKDGTEVMQKCRREKQPEGGRMQSTYMSEGNISGSYL